MVSEGVFPKTDGDVLYASEVNHSYNTRAASNIKSIANIQKSMAITAGVNPTYVSISPTDVIMETTSPGYLVDSFITTIVSSGGNASYNNTPSYFPYCKGAFNALIYPGSNGYWKSGASITFNGYGQIDIGNGKETFSSGTVSSLNFKTFPGDSEFIFNYKMQLNSTSQSSYMYITDGGSAVPVYGDDNTGLAARTKRQVVRCKIDKTNGRAYYKYDNSEWNGPVHIANLGSWYVRFSNSLDASSTVTNFAYVGSQIGSVFVQTYPVSGFYLGMTYDTSKIFDKCFLSYDTTIPSGISTSVSLDGGNTFTTVQKEVVTSISPAGSVASVKIWLPLPSTITGSPSTVNAENIKELKYYGVYFISGGEL